MVIQVGGHRAGCGTGEGGESGDGDGDGDGDRMLGCGSRAETWEKTKKQKKLKSSQYMNQYM